MRMGWGLLEGVGDRGLGWGTIGLYSLSRATAPEL